MDAAKGREEINYKDVLSRYFTLWLWQRSPEFILQTQCP
jgi:hypothetical protein